MWAGPANNGSAAQHVPEPSPDSVNPQPSWPVEDYGDLDVPPKKREGKERGTTTTTTTSNAEIYPSENGRIFIFPVGKMC